MSYLKGGIEAGSKQSTEGTPFAVAAGAPLMHLITHLICRFDKTLALHLRKGSRSGSNVCYFALRIDV